MTLTSDIQYIVDAVNSFDKLILYAPTGSGKSTILPDALANKSESVWIAIDTHDSIIESIVNHARKTATSKLVHITDPISTVVPGTVIYSNRETLARSLNTIKDRIDIVILDDAHINSVDGLAIVNTIVNSVETYEFHIPKLILMSAEKMAAPYEDFVVLNLNEKGLKYSIDVRYHGNVESNEEIVSVIVRYSSSPVFVPGKHFLLFVDDMTKYDKLLRDKNIRTLVVRSIEKDLATLTYRSTVIIAGSELSSAITIPGVSVVFDLLVKKVNLKSIFDTDLPASFVNSYITKAEANQRKGRTGRTNNGICYRFCTEKFFSDLLDHEESYLEPTLLSCSKLIDYSLDPSVVYDRDLTDMIDSTMQLGLTKADATITTPIYHSITDSKLSVESGLVLYYLFTTDSVRIKKRTALFMISCIETLTKPRAYYRYPSRGDISVRDYVTLADKYRREMYRKYGDIDDFYTISNILRDKSKRRLTERSKDLLALGPSADVVTLVSIRDTRIRAIYETYDYLTRIYGVSSSIPSKFDAITVQAVRDSYAHVGTLNHHTKVEVATLVSKDDITPEWRNDKNNFYMSKFSITRVSVNRPKIIVILSHTNSTIDNVLV
uniref:Helicase C-terminal domain-containing protein n=1 Tax=Pithovirus LCPAC404 TaxID=2506597 RepID=A0A481ZDT0_9VIRU|nr:MAG: uncharacterized protein LCPAC404_00140 [Pithovirus LCPAC404]